MIATAGGDEQRPAVGAGDRTAAGERGAKLANAASNSGRPVDGIAHLSYSDADSSSDSALPNPYRKSEGDSATVRDRLAGLRRAIEATRSADGGSTNTPLTGAGSMATPARARPRPSRFCASSPPNECPMTTGFDGSAWMMPA